MPKKAERKLRMVFGNECRIQIAHRYGGHL